MLRKSPLPLLLTLTVVTLAIMAGPAVAQHQVTRTMEISDPAQTAMIPELGALLIVNDSVLEVINVAPPAQRPEGYAEVDLQNGDRVLMANGKRIHDGAELTALMDALEPGEAIKLGIKRGEQMRMVSFARGNPEDRPSGMMMMTMTADSTGAVTRSVQMVGDGAGEAEVLADLGVLLMQTENGIEVADLMPELTEVANDLPIKEGDVITAISGKSVASLAEFMEEFGKIGAGDKIDLDFRRDGEMLKAVIIHP